MSTTTPATGLRTGIVAAAAASAGAGLIHATAAGAHEGAQSLVWMFAICAAAQLGWAAIAVLVPNRAVMAAGAGINGAALVVWFMSRTVGVPLVDALAEPEALGTQDVLAAMLAAIAVGACVLVITQPIARRTLPNAWSAVIVFAAIALVVPALAAGHTHAEHDHLADEHIHAADEAAHTHDADEAGDHDDDGHAHDDVEVAGAVAHNDDDGHHSNSTNPASTTNPTHPNDGHSHTNPASSSNNPSTPNSHHDDPTQPPHAHGPTPPGTTPPHTHGPTPPGTKPPPHAHPPAKPTGPIVSVNDPRLSATQRSAAGNLLLSTITALQKYPTVAAVQAAGYQSIGDASTGYEHFVNWSFLLDSVELDPNRIESIVAKVNPNGTRTIASGMYILALGKTMANVPEIAGELTTWHDHQNLCWTSTPGGGQRVTGTTDNGRCPPGSVFIPTPPMLHVWLTPQACGPFTGIEGTHGSSSCSHSH